MYSDTAYANAVASNLSAADVAAMDCCAVALLCGLAEPYPADFFYQSVQAEMIWRLTPQPSPILNIQQQALEYINAILPEAIPVVQGNTVTFQSMGYTITVTVEAQ